MAPSGPGGRVIAGLLLALALVLGAGVLPRPIAAAAPARVEIQPQIDESSVDFPASLDFHLVLDAPQPVTAAELRLQVVNDPVTSLVYPADFTPGTHVEIRYSRDMRINYVYPGVEMLAHWRLTGQDGTVYQTPERRFRYLDQRFDWITLTEGQTTLYYAGSDRAFAQQALDVTTASLERFKGAFGVVDDDPITVIMYGSLRDFAGALSPGSAEWVGGEADPGLRIIITGITAGDTQEMQRILSHEVIHIVVAAATDNPFNAPPRWLDEGLAGHYQTVTDSRNAATLQQAIRAGQLDSVRALNSRFPEDPALAVLAYAESESIVRFILETKGEAAMAKLLATFTEGVAYGDAVQRGLGLSLEDLDREWKAWLGYQGDRSAAAVSMAGDGRSAPFGGVIPIEGATAAALVLLALAAGAALAVRRGRRDAAS